MRILIALIALSLVTSAQAQESLAVDCNSLVEKGLVETFVFKGVLAQMLPNSPEAEKSPMAGMISSGVVRENTLILLLENFNGFSEGAHIEISRVTGLGNLRPPNYRAMDSSGPKTPAYQCTKSSAVVRPPSITPVNGVISVKCRGVDLNYGYRVTRESREIFKTSTNNQELAGRVNAYRSDRITFCKDMRCSQGYDLINLITGYHFHADPQQDPSLVGKCETDMSEPAQKKL